MRKALKRHSGALTVGQENGFRTAPLGRFSFAMMERWPKAIVMPIDPSKCRQHALDCVRMAQTATTPEAKKTWSDLAKTWLKFASDLEANECIVG
jgi:hypothetical protein